MRADGLRCTTNDDVFQLSRESNGNLERAPTADRERKSRPIFRHNKIRPLPQCCLLFRACLCRALQKPSGVVDPDLERPFDPLSTARA